MSYIFLSIWSVLAWLAHSTPLLLGHACRKGHVPSDIETRVVTTPWKITLQQHVLRLLSRNLCVVVSGLHLVLCVVVLHQPIRGPRLCPSGQLEAWNSSKIFHSQSFQWPTWQCLIWRMKTYDWFYAEFRIGHQSCPLQVHGSSYHEWNNKELNDAILLELMRVTNPPQGQ